jgi:hypothetical protein
MISDDDKVLPFLVWQRDYSGLSEPTARRICRPGAGGPPLVRLLAGALLNPSAVIAKANA